MTVILINLTIPLRSLAWWIWADRHLQQLGAGRATRLDLQVPVLVVLAGTSREEAQPWRRRVRQLVPRAGQRFDRDYSSSDSMFVRWTTWIQEGDIRPSRTEGYTLW